jgi:CDP-diacylglycerol--serine O-phosphatidyltransferase
MTREERWDHKLRRREHRNRRLRRHGRRAYIRSAYSLPSLATLGNAVCGFGSMYVASLHSSGADYWTGFFRQHQFVAAAYLIFASMLFDALDGRLARFTRHTTDFGGQLDSLADVISFGTAPAFLALQLFKTYHQDYGWAIPPVLSRLIWAIGALYVSCAAMRLARFNVSNEHGEQHHFSFLGLPSPGAGAAVAALVLMQQDLAVEAHSWTDYPRLATAIGHLATICVWLLPVVVLATGLLMVSKIRYPHVVNRYLRGKASLGRVILILVLLLGIVVAHRYVLGIGILVYVAWGLLDWGWFRIRPRAIGGGSATSLGARP